MTNCVTINLDQTTTSSDSSSSENISINEVPKTGILPELKHSGNFEKYIKTCRKYSNILLAMIFSRYCNCFRWTYLQPHIHYALVDR